MQEKDLMKLCIVVGILCLCILGIINDRLDLSDVPTKLTGALAIEDEPQPNWTLVG